ncbi:MAG: TetR/AcrR family transcriptional regulator [Pseudomonadales bacterium]|nr:TetR/AcrR family transcriptional regulator [Pseudomonadales bacterium]
MNNSALKKRESTRIRVIEAAINCIDREGFHAAHTNRIAKAADVSWGVIQYHFADKDGLLQAVIDHIFDDFSQTLSETALTHTDLQDRIRQIIEVVWRLVSKKEYRVSIAILRNSGQDPSSSIDGQQQLSRWAKKTDRLWDKLLSGIPCDTEKSQMARHILFATLRGMADEVNPRKSRRKKQMEKEREALAKAITFLLTSP